MDDDKLLPAGRAKGRSAGEAPIVVLSDSIEGGAARSTGRLIECLRTDGLNIERWHCSRQPLPAPEHYFSLDNRRKRPPVERVLKNVSCGLARKSQRRRHNAALLAAVEAKAPAMINVRNIHSCGLNHESLMRLPKAMPLVWTMHDCWPFAVDAFRWKNSNTGAWETAVSDRPEEAATRRRTDLFKARSDMVLVSPSVWLAEEARKVVPIRVEHIPNGVTTEVFQPVPKPEAKQILGLDPDRTWLAFGSTWANSRKGTDVIIEALAGVDASSIGLLTWGGDIGAHVPAGVAHRHCGRIFDDHLLKLLYSAADIFICPSRADNLPNTILEGLACGTPAIGSNVGGIPDMVIPDKTGWLYEGDSPTQCTLALKQAMADRWRWAGFQQAARTLAVETFDVRIAARRYAALYRELLGQSGTL